MKLRLAVILIKIYHRKEIPHILLSLQGCCGIIAIFNPAQTYRQVNRRNGIPETPSGRDSLRAQRISGKGASYIEGAHVVM